MSSELLKKLEYVYLMCLHKRPISWTTPKQFISGEHDLWVKADISDRGIPNSIKEAVVNFKVTLDSNKSYMLNREIKDEKISLWIQEVDTGDVVSQTLIKDLKRPLASDHYSSKEQCKSSSV